MLDFIDPFNLKQKFDIFNVIRDFGKNIADDYNFLQLIRKTFLPIPFIDQTTTPRTDIFPPFNYKPIPFFSGKKIAMVNSGGSGALVTMCGIYRAFEEAGIDITAISVCSGSALWGTLIAAGMSAQEMTEFTLSWNDADYLDLEWSRVLKALLTAGKGFSGLLRGEAVEKTYRKRLGEIRLSQSPIRYYTIVYNMDLGQVEYFGSGLKPDVTLAKAVRVSIALPLFVESVDVGGHLYNDGGIIDIFPVEPLLKYEKDVDFFIGVNCIFPKNFISEDISGWRDKHFAIFEASEQLRFANWLDLGRRNLDLVKDRILLLHPLPYTEIRGKNFYSIFVDRQRWTDLILRAYHYTRKELDKFR
ncbi:patatin-like phospholipase family protein [candidate division CSSED10-310 bacterium]|uniref:Patatin-like phospholipase family protein n=1 Tax=candidate division CSSED10-310 bacterium TaxID=2855610 RepID=A0ABV6YV35_UNCC1